MTRLIQWLSMLQVDGVAAMCKCARGANIERNAPKRLAVINLFVVVTIHFTSSSMTSI